MGLVFLKKILIILILAILTMMKKIIVTRILAWHVKFENCKTLKIELSE